MRLPLPILLCLLQPAWAADEAKPDAPVHALAPEVWFENPSEASDPVRVVDLLEHTTGWVSIVGYALFWLIGRLIKSRRRPAERAMRVAPLLAVVILAGILAVISVSSEDAIDRLGGMTGWSVAIFLGTIAFALASLAATWAAFRAPRSVLRLGVRWHAKFVALALLIATAYLALYGVIGIRTWA